MIEISIFHANKKDCRFDMDYYLHTHMPRSIHWRSEKGTLKGVSVERGLGGAISGSEPAYIELCHFLFESLEDFMSAFAPHAPALQGYIPRHTDIKPLIQVSEVAISH